MMNTIDMHKKISQDLFFRLSALAIIASAFHFWPFDNSKIWQLANPANMLCMVAFTILLAYIFYSQTRQKIENPLPHISILAYLIVNILSVAHAQNFGRSLNYTAKLCLVMVGGFFLFSVAASTRKHLLRMHIAIVIAAVISVAGCFIFRFILNADRFGFHENAYKYGTYIGIIVPMACLYLLNSNTKIKIYLAFLLLIVSIITSGTIGAIFAISVSTIIPLTFSKQPLAKILMATLIMTVSLSILFFADINNINSDFQLAEKDNINLRQRYIEWQAQINLLSNKAIPGTGAGCVNDYRSEFYYRLPKLNTLKPFDQNGFLSVAAETGFVGLACFIWIILHYGKKCFIRNNNTQLSIANAAGFIGACIGNIFSSVHYNGNLITFVLVLALINSTNQLYGENKNEI